MPRIRFDKVTFGYIDPLFSDVTFDIGDYDRVGIVGNNGCGKSTLLKCIAGLIEPQKGKIISPKGLRFGFIEQDVPQQLREMNLFDVICDVLPADEKSHSIWKVETTLDVFKAPEVIRNKPVKELSGGWQRLALIARVVLSNPDALLLDEPTNHLDVEKILVLEKWLNEQVYEIPLFAISHDRSFLANCTNKTFFLRGTEICEFNYSYFQAKQLLLDNDTASVARRSKELKEVNRLQRSAHDLRQVGVNNYSDAALKKSVQIAKRADEIKSQLTAVHVEPKRSIKLSNSGFQTKKLVSLSDLTVCTPDGTSLFYIEQLDIICGERLVISGPNGSGKSQFIKFLHNAMSDIDKAREQGVIVNPSVKLGYVDQHLSHLPLQMSLRDYFDSALTLGHQRITGILIDAGFPITMHNTKLGLLSHGQRARAAFLKLRLTMPNFYVMDEPTNHLDIAGQEQLESEIVDQGATTVIVTHDRVLAQNIGTKFYTIKNKRLVLSD